jgi:hypothetical protein
MPTLTTPRTPAAANLSTGVCSVCRAAPSLIAVEANGLAASGSTICSGCFAQRVREQRARRVTPVDGLPAYTPPVR